MAELNQNQQHAADYSKELVVIGHVLARDFLSLLEAIYQEGNVSEESLDGLIEAANTMKRIAQKAGDIRRRAWYELAMERRIERETAENEAAIRAACRTEHARLTEAWEADRMTREGQLADRIETRREKEVA